jgi:heat shock protein HslJ
MEVMFMQRVILLVMLAGIVAACSDPAVTASSDPSEMIGQRWVLMKVYSGSTEEDVSIYRAVLRFSEPDTVRGSGPDNSFHGFFKASADGTLRITQLGVTALTGCCEDFEDKYFGALSAATRFEILDGALVIHFGETGRLEFVRE